MFCDLKGCGKIFSSGRGWTSMEGLKWFFAQVGEVTMVGGNRALKIPIPMAHYLRDVGIKNYFPNYKPYNNHIVGSRLVGC